MSGKKKIGDFGEKVIANFLMKKGYQILDRNYSKPYGEIDIIALKNDIVCFVEVKTRRSVKYGYPREAVDYYKQQRIIRASQTYLMENKLYDYIIRYDVGEVFTESRKINYIENAF